MSFEYPFLTTGMIWSTVANMGCGIFKREVYGVSTVATSIMGGHNKFSVTLTHSQHGAPFFLSPLS